MAIVTNRIKKQVVSSIQSDFNLAAENYYAVIGRSEDWNDSDVPPAVTNSMREERNFRLGTQSAKQIIDLSFVVPRYNWSSGAIYSAYDDVTGGYPSQAYYVINDNNQVYMCIQQGKNASGQPVTSTVQPTGNTTGTPFDTADGYIWKFLYSISALDANKYVSANYLPIKLQGATDSDSPAADIEQLAVQNAAISGQIIGYAVDSGGTGYSSTPTIAVSGNGTKAKAAATISGGQVVKVELIDSSGNYTLGSGYNFADVSVTGGGSPTKPASVRAILGTPLGLGGDPRDDLRSTALMFNTKPDGVEGNDFIVGNDFRQVGLMKNLKDSAAGTDFSQSTGIMLKQLRLSSVTSGFTSDNIIEGSTSGIQAYIDKVDSSNIWYHQSEVTGFGNFDSGENITETNGNGAGVLNATYAPYIKPEIDMFSGDLLYIDNRAAITRASDQTEDIKIVIQI
tara:strand:- start:6545 stop:7903 length:1359 start_codon:yes stop_codon:yes gene_type:complete